MSYSAIVMISSLAEDVKNEHLRAFSCQLSALSCQYRKAGREHDRQLVLPIPRTNPNSVGQECPIHTG
jgi:hypothetical protein